MSTEVVVMAAMDVRSAAAVRQVLFESQKDYTYDPTCTPERIVDIRKVISELDEGIEKALETLEKEEAKDAEGQEG